MIAPSISESFIYDLDLLIMFAYVKGGLCPITSVHQRRIRLRILKPVRLGKIGNRRKVRLSYHGAHPKSREMRGKFPLPIKKHKAGKICLSRNLSFACHLSSDLLK